MASKRASVPAKRLFDCLKPQPRQQCFLQRRTMATETHPPSPEATLSETHLDAHLEAAPTEPILQDHPSSAIPPQPQPQPQPPLQQHFPTTPHRNPFLTTTHPTLHTFPTFEPTGFTTYPSTHLLVPLRKDILHRAVIYEGDKTRQGTASTKWRSEVHGSNRKIRPQKGTGSARLGDKKSPMLRGGGVAFGPKPRDFSTELPRRIYDLAWRTALSYRYKMGQLMLIDGTADLLSISREARPRYLQDALRHNHLGRPDGRTLFVTLEERGGLGRASLGREGNVKEVEDVDVKDLLGLGRVVMELEALEWIFMEHESDLAPGMRLEAWRELMEKQKES